MPTTDDIYLRSPRHLQTLLANAASIGVWRKRYGNDFESILDEYEARDLWSAEELAAYGDAQRALTLARASRTPFYQAVFRSMDAHWTDFLSREAFAEIPVTSKHDLRERPEAFRPRAQLDTDTMVQSSGTTGWPTRILKDRMASPHQWAVWWRYRRWHGIDMATPCALFSGRRVMRDDQTQPFWRHNYVGKETRFSTFHISAENAPMYVHQLNAGAPTWIHGYSSPITNLARFIVEGGLRVTAPISVVSLGGENVLPWQVNLIEKAFGRRPIHHYGLAEQVANASVCPDGALHIDEDFGLMELVGPPDSPQRIIGTPYTNSATALLRYDTGDVAQRHPGGACTCGRQTALLGGIDGRSDETVELPDGRLVGPRRAFRINLNITEAQIVQHQDLSLTVRYVTGPQWQVRELADMEAALRDVVGDSLPIRCQEVDAVPRTASGKLRLVVKE